jgi:hypothetical protein
MNLVFEHSHSFSIGKQVQLRIVKSVTRPDKIKHGNKNLKNMAIERHGHETSIRIHHLIVSQYSKIIFIAVFDFIWSCHRLHNSKLDLFSNRLIIIYLSK